MSTEAKTATDETSPKDAAPQGKIDPAVMEAGKTNFALCSACHGPNGEGVANLGPPLAGSEWVNGPPENLIRIQYRGLHGPITVKGKEYTPAAPMPPQMQTNEAMAAVLTYVRNSMGNEAPAVTVDMVDKLASEKGKPPLTVADLVDPLSAPKAGDGGDAPAVKMIQKPTNPLPNDSVGAPGLALAAAGILIALIIIAVLRIFAKSKA